MSRIATLHILGSKSKACVEVLSERWCQDVMECVNCIYGIKDDESVHSNTLWGNPLEVLDEQDGFHGSPSQDE